MIKLKESLRVGYLAKNVVEDSPVSPEGYFGLCVEPDHCLKLFASAGSDF